MATNYSTHKNLASVSLHGTCWDIQSLKEKWETGNAKIASVNTVSIIYSHLFSLSHLWPNNDVTGSGHIIHHTDRRRFSRQYELIHCTTGAHHFLGQLFFLLFF